MAMNLILENAELSFEVTCADNTDLDGTFEATCMETGELLQINGWLFDITDISNVDLHGWTPASEAA